MPERVFKVAEVQAHLRSGRNSAYGLIASGAIKSIRLGEGPNAPIRVTESALNEFLAGGTSLVASIGTSQD